MRCKEPSQVGWMILFGTVTTIPVWMGVGASAGGGEPPVSFEDVSALLGDFEHQSVLFGGDGLAGAVWFDFDNDGDLDLFVTNGKGHDNALFENDGKGGFTDIAEAAGVANGLGNSGAIAADIDNDGLQDLFLTGDGGFGAAGDSPVKLYHNQGGGVFTDITMSSGIIGGVTTLSAAFADIDNDGFLDLFITAPGSLATHTQHANTLYHNNGDLTFTDISAASGVDTVVGACAAFFSDYNGDGWIDLFVANCNNVSLLPTPIELFENQGDLTFCEVSASVGLSSGGFWMGVAPADFDLDGNLDFFVTNIGNGHRLYRANGDATYTDISIAAGVRFHEFGWGCTSRDLDNDGYPDIFFAGSLPFPPFNVIGPGLGNPGTLLFNNQAGAFDEWTFTFPVNMSSRYTSGVAAGDYDNDGFQDLFIAVSAWADEPGQPLLVRNLGNENGAVTIRLQGTVSNRDAVGARVQVTVGGRTQLQEIYAGSSFLSMDSQWLTFGLGKNLDTEQINVRWPSGLVETFPNASAGETVLLVEGSAGDPCPAGLDCSVPDEFSAFRGFYVSGDLNSLLESDDDKLCYNPGIVLLQTEAPITLDFFGTLPNDSPSTLDVTIESSANTVGLELTVSFWNYNTDSWDVVGTDTQSLNDDTVRTFAGNPLEHVEPVTGEVRTRYEVRVVSFIFVFPWLDCVDHVYWTTSG